MYPQKPLPYNLMVSTSNTHVNVRCGRLVERNYSKHTIAFPTLYVVVLLSALYAPGQAIPTCLVPPGPNGGFLYDNNGTSCLAAHNVVYAPAFSGADPCAQINAAIAALAPPGGIVDARGFQGTQACASNPFNGIGVDVELLLGAVSIQTTVPWVTPSAHSVVILGSGRGGSGHGTTIFAASGFPSTCDSLTSGCPVVRLGDGTAAFGHRIENLVIDCNNRPGCIGLYSNNIQEQSGAFRFLIQNFIVYGIYMDGTPGPGMGAENYTLQDGEVYFTNPMMGSGAAVIGVNLISNLSANNGPRLVSAVTSNGLSSNNILTSFNLAGITTGVFEGLNAESSVTGYTLDNNGGHGAQVITLDSIQCNVIMTNCLWIKGGNDINVVGIMNAAFATTTTIRDDANGGLLITGFSVSTYTDGNAGLFHLNSSTNGLNAFLNLNIGAPSGSMGGGVFNNGGGFKHKRGTAGCTTGSVAGNTCTTTVTWTTPFADANYTAECTGNAIGTGTPAMAGIASKSAASVQAVTITVTPTASGFANIECIAVHD